jgi:signal peptidase I
MMAHALSIFLLISTVLLMAGCSGSSEPTATNSAPRTSPSKTFKFSGASMEPSLHDGDKVKALVVNRELRRGDVVVFTMPGSPGSTLVKRIIGLPTETIEIKEGQVIINGVNLNEPYIMEPPSYSLELTLIPDKSYFILGDNRNQSKDSHNFGAVPLANIQYIVEIK